MDVLPTCRGCGERDAHPTITFRGRKLCLLCGARYLLSLTGNDAE